MDGRDRFGYCFDLFGVAGHKSANRQHIEDDSKFHGLQIHLAGGRGIGADDRFVGDLIWSRPILRAANR